MADSGWLKALDVRGTVAAAVALSATIAVIGAAHGWLWLDALPHWILGLIAASGILAAMLLAARLWEWVADKIDRWRTQRRYEAKVLAYLDSLDERERRILSYLVMRNEQSFRGDIHAGYATMLVQKGLVVAGGQSQMVHIFECPYLVPPFVWRELQRRKSQFQTADPKARQPWRIPTI